MGNKYLGSSFFPEVSTKLHNLPIDNSFQFALSRSVSRQRELSLIMALPYIDFINNYNQAENIFHQNRIFQDHMNPMENYNEEQFRARFRFSKEAVRDVILPALFADLARPTTRNQALTPIQQLCTALRFYACGSYMRILGDTMGLHSTTVSKVVRNVSISIIHRLKDAYVKIPNNQNELLEISNDFRERCNFPGVIGAIDCTHIRIIKPSRDPATFVNRKGYYSFNCQMICDSKLRFWNVVARWPGSTHDSRVLDNSVVGHQLETGQLRGLILGDPGYACLPHLMTPIMHPANPREVRYNVSQRSARNVIERAFGLLKQRFGALGPDSRLRFCSLDTDMAIIVACTTLHNIAIVVNEPQDFPEQLPANLDDFNQFVNFPPNARGFAVRQAIVNEYF